VAKEDSPRTNCLFLAQLKGSIPVQNLGRTNQSGELQCQRVLGTLGKRDVLVASGALDGLLQSIERFSEGLHVVEAARTKGIPVSFFLELV